MGALGLKNLCSAGANRSPVTDINKSLINILADLRQATDLREAENALDAVGEVFDLPFTFWALDAACPHLLPEMDRYARSRGWPDDLLQFWWDRHAALKMPVYIRCRSESLPFVISLDSHRNRYSSTSSEEKRVTALLKAMGVTTVLVIPSHLPMRRIAMSVLAGSRKSDEIKKQMLDVEGDLLAFGHRFMSIVSTLVGDVVNLHDEQSRLTPREWDCVRILAQGYREAEIGPLIGVSRATVRFHVDNVVKKFGCRTRTQAIALLAQLGLLGPIGA
jgi:DNA-binding CsgD family transcriptional regulator